MIANVLSESRSVTIILVLYLKRPRAKSWELRRMSGRFRYSDLKEAPWGLWICIWMSRLDRG